ncbi:MAG: DUF4339 domain-containing protein [Microthrixaceae bacterium]
MGPDDQRGPYTMELLVSEVAAGRLDENTPVWWPGLADWTTMAAHPGVAGEIARRRAPQEQAPGAFAPAGAPPPPQAAQPAQQHQPVAEQQPQPGAEQQAQQAQFRAEQQAQQAQFGAEQQAQPGAAFAPAQDVAQEEAQAAFAPSEAPATQDQPGGGEGSSDQGSGASAFAASAIEVPAVEVGPADFAAVDEETSEEGFRAAGAAEGLDPGHAAAFAEVVRRSRARADAASIIQDVDDRVVSAVDAAAQSQGFSNTARGRSDERHELSYVASDGSVLTVQLGRVRGRDLAGPDGEIPLDASVSSESYSGSIDEGTGRHGEVVVRAAEYENAYAASVELLLGLPDYVDADYDVDSEALERDLRAVIATLTHRLNLG